ncbi:MAG: GNAT family N-acetyltransferase [Kineosporiaceae bacterium]
MSPAAPDEVVRHHPDAARFELALDGRPVSWLEYTPVESAGGAVWRVDHTVTMPEMRGHGHAGRLVAHLVEAAIAQGVRIDPRCPYVRDWLARHPEHATVVGSS